MKWFVVALLVLFIGVPVFAQDEEEEVSGDEIESVAVVTETATPTPSPTPTFTVTPSPTITPLPAPTDLHLQSLSQTRARLSWHWEHPESERPHDWWFAVLLMEGERQVASQYEHFSDPSRTEYAVAVGWNAPPPVTRYCYRVYAFTSAFDHSPAISTCGR